MFYRCRLNVQSLEGRGRRHQYVTSHLLRLKCGLERQRDLQLTAGGGSSASSDFIAFLTLILPCFASRNFIDPFSIHERDHQILQHMGAMPSAEELQQANVNRSIRTIKAVCRYRCVRSLPTMR